jgi:hypothetical protein
MWGVTLHFDLSFNNIIHINLSELNLSSLKFFMYKKDIYILFFFNFFN